MQDNEVLAILKIVVMVIFFIIVTIFGTLPIRSKNFKKRPLLKAIGATFAGCLFLNVAIMHILPEAADTLQQYLKDGDDDKQVFPLAYLLLMVGFIITVFFTKVLSFHSHQQDHQLQIAQSDSQVESPHKKKIQEQESKNQIQTSSNQIKQSLLTQSDDLQKKNAKKLQIDKKKVKTKATPETNQNSGHNYNHAEDQNQSHHHRHQHDHKHGHEHKSKNKSVLNQAFILTLAIYFHTIFEGIAIGVQNSITGFLSTAVAIAFHKWADALSMGLHYKSKNVTKKLSYTLIIIQAVLNVLSIGLGWIIESSGDVVQAVFLSISAGTFLAISTLQMLGQQLHHRQYMIVKFLLLVGATGFVASIWFLENTIFNQ